MDAVLVGLGPLSCLYLSLAVLGLVTRRGRSRLRSRSLSQRTADTAGLDISREAAARLIAGRLIHIINMIFLLLLLLLVGSGLRWFIAIPILLLVVGVMTYDYVPSNLYYFLVTNHVSVALLNTSMYYKVFSLQGAGRRLLRRWFPDTAMIITGAAMIVGAGLSWAYYSNAIVLVPGLYIQHSKLSPALIPLVEGALGALLMTAGVKLDRHHRRRDMLGVTAVRNAISGPTPSTVFLRQFGAEETRVPCHAGARDSPHFLSIIPQRSIYLEDAMTWICWAWGPVLSISDPRRNPQHTLGAARYRVKETEDWQHVVTRLIDGARLVIIICGPSDGIRWEIDQILQDPERTAKTIFVNPTPRHAEDFAAIFGMINTSPADRCLLAAVMNAGEFRPIWSVLAEDVDYEIAVQWIARELSLFEDIPDSIRRARPGTRQIS